MWIKDVVDVALFKDGNDTERPKGFDWFQVRDEETGVDGNEMSERLLIAAHMNPKLFKLQEL